jgi:phage-related tail fiber protein
MAVTFDKTFGENGLQAPISDEQWRGGWSAIVGGANGIPTSEQFNTVENYLDSKANALYQMILNNQNGLMIKAPCRVATTANITLSGTQTIDGIALVAGNSVLVKNQGVTSQNGIYTVAAGAWTRRADADSAAEILGIIVPVMEGTANAGSLWFQKTPSPITLGSTAILFIVIVSSQGADMVDGKHATDTANNIPVYDANKVISGKAATAGHADTASNASNADNAVNANNASTAVVALGLEVRTNDPSGASIGRMWFRSDIT